MTVDGTYDVMVVITWHWIRGSRSGGGVKKEGLKDLGVVHNCYRFRETKSAVIFRPRHPHATSKTVGYMILIQLKDKKLHTKDGILPRSLPPS